MAKDALNRVMDMSAGNTFEPALFRFHYAHAKVRYCLEIELISETRFVVVPFVRSGESSDTGERYGFNQ